jgi:hypothetical protein
VKFATAGQDTGKRKPCDLKSATFILCEKQFESHTQNIVSRQQFQNFCA